MLRSQKGLHKWIEPMDLNSRIPRDSVVEHGPETIVGQIRPEIHESQSTRRYYT